MVKLNRIDRLKQYSYQGMEATESPSAPSDEISEGFEHAVSVLNSLSTGVTQLGTSMTIIEKISEAVKRAEANRALVFNESPQEVTFHVFRDTQTGSVGDGIMTAVARPNELVTLGTRIGSTMKVFVDEDRKSGFKLDPGFMYFFNGVGATKEGWTSKSKDAEKYSFERCTKKKEDDEEEAVEVPCGFVLSMSKETFLAKYMAAKLKPDPGAAASKQRETELFNAADQIQKDTEAAFKKAVAVSSNLLNANPATESKAYSAYDDVYGPDGLSQSAAFGHPFHSAAGNMLDGNVASYGQSDDVMNGQWLMAALIGVVLVAVLCAILCAASCLCGFAGFSVLRKDQRAMTKRLVVRQYGAESEDQDV